MSSNNTSCQGGSGPIQPTCDDGRENGNETGIDCGGDCEPCSSIGTDLAITHIETVSQNCLDDIELLVSVENQGESSVNSFTILYSVQ